MPAWPRRTGRCRTWPLWEGVGREVAVAQRVGEVREAVLANAPGELDQCRDVGGVGVVAGRVGRQPFEDRPAGPHHGPRGVRSPFRGMAAHPVRGSTAGGPGPTWPRAHGAAARSIVSLT